MHYAHFTNEITTAYEHRGGIKTLKLGRIEESWFREIQADCAWIFQNAGSSDVTDRKHVTNWTRPSGQVRQFSLFNKSGESADTKGDYGYLGDAKQKRLVYPQLNALSRFAALFMPALRNLRLNGMGPNSALDAHEESSIQISRLQRQHIVRFHLPVFSNAGARVFLDDESFVYEEGNVYFFHHGCVHAATNRGNEPRYHLVLDCFLDRALFGRLFPGSPSPDPAFIKMSEAEAVIAGELYHFPNFVKESGQLIEGAINYGRRAPTFLAPLQKRYPSIFGAAQ
jgi:hypothetical protein